MIHFARMKILCRIVRDPAFVLALLAGPAAWLALWLFDALPATLPAALLLRFIVVQPVIEELAFRGLLQGWLKTRVTWMRGGISAANVLTSVAFVAAHLVYQPPAWALAVFAPSIVFGYFRDRHDSVVPALLLHAWYNAGLFLLPVIALKT